MFNVRLRQILFSLIEEIEIKLRYNISNFTSIKYVNLSYENEEAKLLFYAAASSSFENHKINKLCK